MIRKLTWSKRKTAALILFCTVLLFSTTVYSAPPLPESSVTSEFFYRISQTNDKVWVAPSVWKVMKDTSLPVDEADAVMVHAAQNEYEPVQIVVLPGSNGTAKAALTGAWTGPSGDVIEIQLHQVHYVPITTINSGDPHGYPGDWPDPLYPIAQNESVSVTAGSNQPFWVTFYVPENTTAGTYENTLDVTVDGSTYPVDVKIQVFDFAIPKEIHFDSYANYNGNNMGVWDDYPNRQEEIMMWWYRHRITPLGTVNFKWGKVWENSSKTPPYAPPVDEIDTEPNAAYRTRELADKYVMGTGFNDVGFPSFESMRFVDNSTPRPSTFAGISRGDDYGTAAYNVAWGAYLTALQNYFDPTVPYDPGNGSYGNPYGHDYLAKARYYVMNEPQNADDYRLAAYLSKLTKQYAPDLKIMISEEPKPEIYAQADYPGYGYDIWLANMTHFSCCAENARVRLRDHGEKTWWYSLGHDKAPYINPILINRPALEPRLLTWEAWKFRVEGYAYYSWNSWSSGMWTDPDFASTGRNGEAFLLYPEPGTTAAKDNFIPSIRLELIREGFEDYEYFILANGGAKPLPFVENNVDKAIYPIIPALTGYNPDPTLLLWARREMGRYISGSRSSLQTSAPDITTSRPSGEYNINFQDPEGEPTADPLIEDGKTWMKVGWDPYDPVAQIGWLSGEANTGVLYEKYDEWDEVPEVQRSLIYNDNGGRDVFLFGIENGDYLVEVAVGYRSSRAQAVSINGVPFVGDHDTGAMETPNGHLVRQGTVKVRGGFIVVEIGRSQSGTNDEFPNEWTMLNYLSITPTHIPDPENDWKALFISCGLKPETIDYVKDYNGNGIIDPGDFIHMLQLALGYR